MQINQTYQQKTEEEIENDREIGAKKEKTGQHLGSSERKYLAKGKIDGYNDLL